LAACFNIRGTLIKALLSRLIREIETPGFASDIFTDTAVAAIVIEIARYLKRFNKQIGTASVGLLPWQLKRIDDYVFSAQDSCPTVPELAGIVGIGERHLMRAFKQSTGRTIGAHVEEIQVRKAKALLLETSLPLKVIAHRLGFAFSSSFSAAFRRATLNTPKAFRQQYRKRR